MGGDGVKTNYNEGHNCDICVHEVLVGRDGDAVDCQRRLDGLSCDFALDWSIEPSIFWSAGIDSML